MALTFNHRAAPPWDMTGGMRGSPFGGVLGSPVDELEDRDIQLAIQASIKEEEVRVSSLCAVLGWVAGRRCLASSRPNQRELTLFVNTHTQERVKKEEDRKREEEEAKKKEDEIRKSQDEMQAVRPNTSFSSHGTLFSRGVLVHTVLSAKFG
jgi:hypothetical protein